MGRLQVNSNIDSYFNNVELLLPMNSSFNDFSKNNFSVTVNGDAVISTAQSKYGGAAGYFTAGAGSTPAGTKSWLTTSSPLLDGINAYTVEAWVYLNSPDYYRTVYSTRVINTGSSFGFTDTNEMFAYSDATGGLFSGTVVPHSQWVHVAWTYDGTNFRMFIDGVKVYDETEQLSHGAGSYIGRASIFPEPDYGEFFIGYMDDFRITKGIARYTSNFTPPSKLPLNMNNRISIKKQNLGGKKLSGIRYASPASIAGLQAFYNFEQTVPNSQLDSSGNGRHLTYQVNTLNAISTTGKINSCVSFTSSPQGLRNQGSKYRTTSWGPNVSSNFSLSVWLKPRSFDAYQHIIGAPFSNRLYIGANGTTLTFNLFNGTVFGVAAPVVTLNTWHHYVFMRNGTRLLLYADNIFIGSTSVAGQSFSPGTAEFHVGGSGPFNEYYYDGDVDALGVWNVVLSQSQINYLWNDGLGVQMP